MEALKGSDSKLFQPLAEAHEVISAADEATPAQTRRRKRAVEQGTVQQSFLRDATVSAYTSFIVRGVAVEATEHAL